jgi:serine/threonine protein kinase
MVSPLPHDIGHYAVQTLIGEGDIARVYRAINRVNGRQVALKLLRTDSPVKDAPGYFENEAAILMQLDHPSIPTLYEHMANKALALEMIDGQDGEMLLAKLPKDDFLTPRRVIQWGIQIADTLAYLHNHHPPIAFRDLKPAHMIVNNSDKAWLVDFNLAKILPDSKYLANADALGTQGFAPPEQYRGTASPLVDIYALGATLHCMLTGIDPRQERRFTFAPPRSINPAIPKSVVQIIWKALAYEPEDRYQEMAEIRDELGKIMNSI